MRKILNPTVGLLANGLTLGFDIERAVFYAGGTLSWLFSGLAGLNAACLLMCLVWFILDALCPSYEVEIELRDPALGDYARGVKNEIVDL